MQRQPRRFYQTAAVQSDAGLHRITLDGRPARTPAGVPLAVASPGLAAAIAAEWHSQGETIDPETMPLTRLTATALDRTPGQRAAIIAELAAYAGSDALCYRAEEPGELAALQISTWQPLLEWAAERLGERFLVTRGVIPQRQPTALIAAVTAAVEDFDDFALTGLADIVPITGSLIVGLALVLGRLDAEAAFRIAFLDECYQAERWGIDAEAAARRDRLAAELAATATFVRLARESVPAVGGTETVTSLGGR